jgi:hypothetical protein
MADTDVPLRFDVHRSVIRTVTRLPSSLAIWGSGARAEVLEHCPSEQLLFSALGASVLLTALYQGFAASFALSYALHMPMSRVWVIGAVWGVTFVNIDRLILMIGSSRRGWLALIPRIVLAILLGVVMAAVLTVHIFAPEINQNLAVTQQAALTRQDTSIVHTYTAKVNAYGEDIAAWQMKEAKLKQTITEDKFLHACELGETDCSTSKILGSGPFAERYANEAADAEASLAALQPIANQQITADKANIAIEENIESAGLTAARSAVANSAGLLARIEALSQLEHGHPDARWAVDILSAVFMGLDLVPALAKFSLVLRGRLVYEQLNEDDQQIELAEGVAARTAAEVELARIDDQAVADMDVNRVLIDLDRQRRIDAAVAGKSPSSSGTRQSSEPRPRNTASVAAPTLAEFVAKARTHEKLPVPLESALRRGALVGLALITATFAVVAPMQLVGHVAMAGSSVVYGAFAGALALAAYSRGFRTAPGWAHRAAFATLVAGIAVPALFGLLNV